MKNQQRLSLLQRAVPPTPGTYVCTFPGCSTRQKSDGFCPAHPTLPLRLSQVK